MIARLIIVLFVIVTSAKYMSSSLISLSNVHPFMIRLPFIILLLYLAPTETLLRTNAASAITEGLAIGGKNDRNLSKLIIMLDVKVQFSKTETALKNL